MFQFIKSVAANIKKLVANIITSGRFLYDSMFEFFTKNKLISDNQSGFKPGYSCVNQLLSITHEI